MECTDTPPQASKLEFIGCQDLRLATAFRFLQSIGYLKGKGLITAVTFQAVNSIVQMCNQKFIFKMGRKGTADLI